MMNGNTNDPRIQTDARPDIAEANASTCSAIVPFRNAYIAAASAPTCTAIVPIRNVRHLLEYDMNHAKRGMAVIFNHEFFLNGAKARSGTNADCELLERTLKKKQFDVSVYRDLSSIEILNEVKQISRIDHSDSDCIVFVMLSHGGPAEISASDTYYKLDVVINHFTADQCPSLAGKPKIFFVQTCRGDLHDTGVVLTNDRRVSYTTVATAGHNQNVEEDWPRASVSLLMRMCSDFFQCCFKKNCIDALQDSATVSWPKHSDFLIAYSTTTGYVSYRNEMTGGRYIQELCKTLDEYGNELNILELLTLVARRVAGQSFDEKKQMPSLQSNLTGIFKLNDKVEENS